MNYSNLPETEYTTLRNEIVEISLNNTEEPMMGFTCGDTTSGVCFQSGTANGFHEADILDNWESQYQIDSLLLESYYDYLVKELIGVDDDNDKFKLGYITDMISKDTMTLTIKESIEKFNETFFTLSLQDLENLTYEELYVSSFDGK